MQAANQSDNNPSLPLIRWSAIAAGATVTLGAISTLYALGVSAGLAAFDIEAPGRPRSVGIFLGIFGMAAPAVGLFLGGLVVGRGSGSSTKMAGFLHGLTMWGISAMALLCVTYMSISTATQGIVGVGKGALQAGQTALHAGGSALADGADGLQDLVKGASRKAQETLSIDPDVVMRALNAKLKERGRKPVSREQVERVLRHIGSDWTDGKKGDRSMVAEAIAQEASMSREDTELVVDHLMQTASEAKTQLQEQASEAKGKLDEARRAATEKLGKTADEAAGMVSKAFGSLFLALVLGLLAAGGGAMLGTRRPWPRTT